MRVNFFFVGVARVFNASYGLGLKGIAFFEEFINAFRI